MTITTYISSYVDFNWSNNFKMKKINSITANATPWVEAPVQFMTLDDHLYFENTMIKSANCETKSIWEYHKLCFC
jgi:hypothetical protein